MKKYIQKIDELNGKQGKSSGIPSGLHFGVDRLPKVGLAVSVDVAKGAGGTGLRKVDVWLMAMVAELESLNAGQEIRAIEVKLASKASKVNLESFRRRLSYLSLNNGWEATLTTADGSVSLAPSWAALLSPKSDERIHNDWESRKDSQDRDGAIEKMLQTWLAGEDRKDNHRLAILGEDFMFTKRMRVDVLREVPTGVFRGTINERTRILPTYWVDLVTLNKRGRLALIELKVSDQKLDVLAQALDYALFFRRYRDRIRKALPEQLRQARRGDMEVYLVNNRFHRYFSLVGNYYQPKSSACEFRMKKVVLGGTSVLGSVD